VVGQNLGPLVKSLICFCVKMVFDKFITLGRIFSFCSTGSGTIFGVCCVGCNPAENLQVFDRLSFAAGHSLKVGQKKVCDFHRHWTSTVG
jgi:hypothetical protein